MSDNLSNLQRVGSILTAAAALLALLAAALVYPVQVRQNSRDIAELRAERSALTQVQLDVAVIKERVETLTAILKQTP